MVDTMPSRGNDSKHLSLQTDPSAIVDSAVPKPQHVWRGRDVVFVDPLDANAPYWWPAMIVPTDEIDASMGCTRLGPEEYLVKYFEDCKYSTVGGRELRLFDTSQPPFTEFAEKSPGFLKDKPIKWALSYLKTGHVHAKFQWKLWQTGNETLRLPFDLPESMNTSSNSPPPAEADDADAGGNAEGEAGLTAERRSSSSPGSPAPLPSVSAAESASDGSTLVSPTAPAIANNSSEEAAGAAADNSPSDNDLKQEGEQADNNENNNSNSTQNDTPISTAAADDHQQQASSTDDTQGDQPKESSVALSESTPASSTTPARTTPEHTATNSPPHTRNRRARQQKPANGAGKRGRPPAGRNKEAPAKQQKGSKSTPATPASTSLAASIGASLADDDASYAVISDIQGIVKELEDMQEEYKVFETLVKRAAKDLWTEMGNEWPPNTGTSTRFGKRRKVN